MLIARKLNGNIIAHSCYITKNSNVPIELQKTKYKIPGTVTTYSIGNDWLNYNKEHQFDEIPEDLDSIISYNRKEVKKFIDDRNIASVGGQVFAVYSE